MPTKVELGFNLSANGIGNYLTLSDPVKGVLNSASYPLAGDVLVDVTTTVREVSVRRGRSRTLERFTAGLAQVTLDNRSRYYDPTFAATTATRTNLVTNPSFEVDATGFAAASTGARSTAQAMMGTASFLVTMSSTTDNNVGAFGAGMTSISVAGSYIVSAYYYIPAGSTLGGRTVTLGFEGGTAVYSNGASSPATLAEGQWVRASRIVTFSSAPATAPALVGRLSGSLASAVGQTLYVDAWLYESGTTLNPYFDGSSSDGSIRYTSRTWTGTANASTSTITYYVPGTGSPYSGSIVPRKQVRITRDGYPIYSGGVESWTWDYDLSGDATAEVRAVDGFASLAQADMTAGTAPGTTPGARIGTALTYAGWPTAARALATGNATLDADVIADGVNVLAYIQKVEQSEPGAFFMSRDGIATFLSRADLQNPTSGNVTFGVGGVPVIEYQAASLTDEMKNNVSVTFTAGSVVGGTVTASDATSIQSYGQFDYSLDTLLDDSLQAQRLADWLVSSYKDPKYRVDSVTVLLDSLTTMQQGQVLDLELGDVVTVAMSLPNINAVGSAVSQVLSIDAIEHQIGIDRHFVTFTMSETTTGFVLNSSDFGVLNSNQLGF